MLSKSKSVSPAEIKALLEFLREIRANSVELHTLIAENPEKISDLVTWPCSWSALYEYSILEHVAIVVVAMEAQTEISIIAKSTNRIEVINKFLDKIEPPAWLGDKNHISKTNLLFCSWYALIKSIRCVELVGNTINGLLKKAREGDLKAILDAVRVDPAAINSPTISSFVALAELTGDYEFLKSLSNAIARPLAAPKVDYGELRYVLTLLEETGQLKKMGEEEKYQLLSLDLALYPSEGDDPAGSLSKFIRRWQKSLRT